MSKDNVKDTNKKYTLTARQKNIIEIIAKFTMGNPVTIATISEKLNLSTRTILREMSVIEEWLIYHNFNFKRKSGVGLILEETLEGHGEILKLLEKEKGISTYSKEERRQHISSEILSTQEPLKSLYFTKKYQISEGTFSNDLEEIRNWCKKFNITLKKKQGLGIYLEGDESNFRQAIGSMIYDICDDAEIYAILKGKSKNITEINQKNKKGDKEKSFFNLIDEETVGIVEKIISELQSYTKIQYMDRSYIGLVIHISLAITRIRNKEKIKMEEWKLQELENSSLYEIAKKFVSKLEKSFQISIPVDEIGFITMHLSGARVFDNSNSTLLSSQEISVRKEILNLVEKVEEKLNIKFYENDTLINDLFSHALPMINRLQLKIVTKNSQLENVKSEYEEIFNAVKISVEELKLFTNYNIESIPEEEICFMVMYFCVAVENNLQINKQVRIIVTCPSGMGTSRMLAMSISKNFPNLHIVNVVSLIDLSKEYLKENSIDIVISTVNIDIDVENIVTSPMLKERDIQLIKMSLEKFEQKKNQHFNKTDVNITKKDIDYISNLGMEIINIISNIKLVSLDNGFDKEFFNEYISKMFTDNKTQSRHMLESIKSQNSFQTMCIENFEISFFQCHINIDKGYLGYIKLNEFLDNKEIEKFVDFEKESWHDKINNNIQGIIVMLVPQRNNIIINEVMNYIKKIIIEDENLYDDLINFKTNLIHQKIERLLIKYYQKTSLKKLI